METPTESLVKYYSFEHVKKGLIVRIEFRNLFDLNMYLSSLNLLHSQSQKMHFNKNFKEKQNFVECFDKLCKKSKVKYSTTI
jgi:hypothetical protein